MKVLITILVLGSAICMAYALCNTCAADTQLACVAENKFKICVDGIPQAPAIVCPVGTICSAGIPVCAPNGTAAPSCTRCNTCDVNNVFACVGYSSFTLCGGTENPNPSTSYPCPDDLVCSIHSPTICVNKNSTGIGATCPWENPETTTQSTTSTTSTTPSPITNPNGFCQNKNFPGIYAVDSDTTCKKYISCVTFNGSLVGNIYECPKGTYFDPSGHSCSSQPPLGCA